MKNSDKYYNANKERQEDKKIVPMRIKSDQIYRISQDRLGKTGLKYLKMHAGGWRKAQPTQLMKNTDK